MSKQRQIARNIREAQGQSHAVEVDGRIYVYKKLKRKKCHQVLYSLVTPFLRAVSAVVQTISIPVEDLKSGKLNVEDWSKSLGNSITVTTDSLADLMQSFPFEDYWKLACMIFDEVEIDGVQYNDLESHEFFDDKPLHMAKAILQGVKVNYPFLKDLVKKKGDGSKDSSPKN